MLQDLNRLPSNLLHVVRCLHDYLIDVRQEMIHKTQRDIYQSLLASGLEIAHGKPLISRFIFYLHFPPHFRSSSRDLGCLYLEASVKHQYFQPRWPVPNKMNDDLSYDLTARPASRELFTSH